MNNSEEIKQNNKEEKGKKNNPIISFIGTSLLILILAFVIILYNDQKSHGTLYDRAVSPAQHNSSISSTNISQSTNDILFGEPSYYSDDGLAYQANQEYEKAIECYKKAIEGRDTETSAKAKNCLGYLYEHGLGCEENKEEALKFYKESAKKNSLGLANLGRCYIFGIGTKMIASQQKEGFECIKKSAEQNDPYGQLLLGMCYYKGICCDKDIDTAKYWLQKSAEQNDETAIKALSQIQLEESETYNEDL